MLTLTLENGGSYNIMDSRNDNNNQNERSDVYENGVSSESNDVKNNIYFDESRSDDQNGEYEVSFDSVTGDYSYIPMSNNSFSLKQKPSDPTRSEFKSDSTDTDTKPERNKKSKRSFILHLSAIIVAIAIILASFAAGSLTIANILGVFSKNGQESNTNFGNISGTKLTVDLSEIEVPTNAVAAATLLAYDSNLLIEAFSDSSGSSLIGTGSGILWNSDGYIVTCNHVVEGSKTVKVTFTDGTSYFVESMATDPITDLALLKITLPEGSVVRPITARNTEKNPLMLGETVIAIGNPLGYFTNTVTDGIISSFEREITVEGMTMTLMQMSAEVNSGNSGGGLFDINGSLVGLVNAKVSQSGVEGIGFAIPIETIIDIVTQLADKGYVSGRPAIGIECVSVTTYNYREIFSNYPDLEKYAVTSSGRWSTINQGIYIVALSDNIKYPDDSNEVLKYGDRIYQIACNDETSIAPNEDIDSFINFISSMNVGDTLHITIIRKGKALTVPVILSENIPK